MRTLRLAGAALLLVLSSVSRAQTPETKAARAFDAAKKSPPLLVAFLARMPKGADLHSHLSGAVYAESLIAWAAENGACVDRASASLVKGGSCGPCGPGEQAPSAACALQDQHLWDRLVDAWSMRNQERAAESGHDHFFDTFGKFGPAMSGHMANALAETASRAARDGVLHLELMHTADDGTATSLATKTGWDDDLRALREKLLAAGFADAVAGARSRLDREEARRDELLRCGTPAPDAGCRGTTRYLYQVLRGLPRELVFAHVLMAFELTKADPRFAGFNLVMPEDGFVAMRDFDLHMRMIEALRPLYPGTHVSLHAGELAMGIVPPEGLTHHIRDSVLRAGAERIGHGVSVMHEDDPVGLLKEMARRGVLVEVCLTSNDTILGVRGASHPLSVYRKYGVPTALATDDQGVSRSDMTHEYLRAALDQRLSYRDLKAMARASVRHAFLPEREKKQLGQRLEKAFAAFERSFR
jgi:hypothetical protein